MPFRFLVLTASLFFSSLIFAQSTTSYPREDWTFNFYLENDMFANTDRAYTNGIKLAWVSPDLEDFLNDEALYPWLRDANKLLGFIHGNPSPDAGLQRNLVFSIGQNIFTPEDREPTGLIEDDRPYAGWLYTSFAWQTKDDLRLDTLEFQLGVIGPAALGQEAQDFIHKLRGIELFNGWDNQLNNEAGLLLLYERKEKIINQAPRDGSFGYDLIPHAGLAIGNVATYLNIGAEIRWGWFIPNDFGTSAIRPGGDNSAPDADWDPRLSGDAQWGLHFFASLDAALVGQDIFLDGNTFSKSHSVSREPWIASAAIGVSTLYHRWKISYAQVFKTRQFKEQIEANSYGSISISFTY